MNAKKKHKEISDPHLTIQVNKATDFNVLLELLAGIGPANLFITKDRSNLFIGA